ncbi:MAG: metal-dependent hydrolase [Acidobacteriota bacterium]
MDPVCHTLTGAALAEAGLKRRTALGTATLLLAANAPDIDVAVFATDTLAVYVRRGWTHGVLALAVLPAVLAGLMLALDRALERRHRPPANLAGLLQLSYLGALSHVLLDWLNSYGIRLLMPFSGRWFYGDALYIVDPWMYMWLGGGVVAARWAARRGPSASTGAARAGLAVAGVYILLALGLNAWARAEVRQGLERAGRGGARFMVTPIPVNPFVREVVVDTGNRYEKGVVWFEPWPHFRPLGYGIDINADDAEARAAAATPAARQFLAWSRFPFFILDRSGDGTSVLLNDYRYSGRTGREGWAAVRIELPPPR